MALEIDLPRQTRALSADGASLIKSYETLRLTAYDDGTGVWTIG